MPQDAFTLRLNARELNATLAGGKINKINQPEREEITFLIYTGKQVLKLALNVNASDCGVYFSDAVKENPAVAPGFCMLLRKHLTNAELKEVSLVGFERILAFRFFCVSDFSSTEKILYAEIMGKYSNLILTENGVITGALKTTAIGENCKRLIFPGAKYEFPEPQDKVDPTDYPALFSLLKDARQENLDEFLFKHVRGIAPVTAENIVKWYGGEGVFAKHVYDYLFSNEITACVNDRDFFARWEDGATLFPTLSAAQAYFYGRKSREKEIAAMKRKLSSAVNSAIKKQEKRLAQILQKRHDCKDAELNRISGELLTANLWKIEKGSRGCELENFYGGGTVKITLDPTKTPSENAQSYFKKYRKEKRTLEALAPQEEETKREISYLRSLSAAAEFAKDKEDLTALEEELIAAGILKETNGKKKKEKVVSFRSFEKDGFRILAGRNNMENDKLVRSARPDDLWLHAKAYHSCHVVVKTEGKPVPDEVLLFAAGICAQYSDGKGDKVPVDYCEVRFVKKPPKSNPGSVVYTDYKTVTVAPLS